MKKLITLSCFILAITTSQAKAANFDAAIGAEYLSKLTKRGVTTYNSFQIIPIWAVNLGSPNFQLVGSTLNYKKIFNNDSFIWRSRLVPNATPDRPMYETRGTTQLESNKRTRTGELDNFIEFQVPELLEVRLQYSQDISAHKGSYWELVPRLIIGSWYKRNGKAMIQPALFASVGYGSSRHNEYLYGQGAKKSSLTNYSYGLLVGSPGAIDTFYPTLQITRHTLTGPARSGSYVAGKLSDVQIIALAAFRIL